MSDDAWAQGYGEGLEDMQRELGVLREENDRLRTAMAAAEWMVQGHVTGPRTDKIWKRYWAALHPGERS
jgi:hypothetical protein